MRKFYFTLSAMLLSACVFSQSLRNDLPFFSRSSDADQLALPAVDAGTSLQRPGSKSDHQRMSAPVLWEEDFGNGFPAGWAVDDISGVSPWKWSKKGSHGNFNNSSGSDYDAPINSTSAANGFLINDPDSANHYTYGQPSGTTYQYLESYFVTNKIDLGASYGSLLLEFEQSYRFNNSVNMVVQISTDSINWTPYNVQGSVANNSASADPSLVSLNISGAVGVSQTLFIRIGWSARVYFWMIDDMRIVEGLENDLSMLDVWHGNVQESLEYQRIPLAQAQEVVIGAACVNQGGSPQTNTIYSYDISVGNNSVASGTFAAANTSISSTASDTTWYETGFVPSTMGTYTVTVSVAADATDELLTNNEAKSKFMITQNIYAHDDEENISLQVSGGVNSSQQANEYKIALYYEVFTNTRLIGVQTAFARNTTTTSCIVEIFDAVNDQALSNPMITEVYDIDSTQISSGAVPKYVNIPLDEGDGIELLAGGVYLISIGNVGVGEELWFLASDGDDDGAQVRYGPFGSGGSVNWYKGYTTSPLIRAQFNDGVGIAEASSETAGFGIYPNPATTSVMLQFNNIMDVEAVSLLDVSGKVVKDVAVSKRMATLQMDISGLSSGIYFVKVRSNGGSAVQKLIID